LLVLFAYYYYYVQMKKERQAGHVAGTEEMRNTYKILVGKLA